LDPIELSSSTDEESNDRKNIMKNLIWVFFLLLFSCSEETPELVFESVNSYYSINPEEYRVYNFERINYDFNVPDTLAYLLKEEIIDSLVTGSGQVSYVLQQSIRENATEPWRVDSVFTIRFQNRGLIAVENNIAYQKLAYPLVLGTTWNGNAFNNLESQIYYYQSTQNPNNSEFINDHSIKVIIEDIPKSFLSQDERFEVYTKDIGLVEKNYIALNFCTNCGDFEGFINSGFTLKQVLIAYGQN
jgi:hypothetical protein